jgi:hypothetical protein
MRQECAKRATKARVTPRTYALEYLGRGRPGEDLGARIEVTERGVVFVGEYRPGLHPAGTVVVALNDNTVTSGRRGHCRVWLSGGQVVVGDCGSDNGTWIARDGKTKRVGTEQSPDVVLPGSEIYVGACRLRLVQSR